MVGRARHSGHVAGGMRRPWAVASPGGILEAWTPGALHAGRKRGPAESSTPIASRSRAADAGRWGRAAGRAGASRRAARVFAPASETPVTSGRSEIPEG